MNLRFKCLASFAIFAFLVTGLMANPTESEIRYYRNFGIDIGQLNEEERRQIDRYLQTTPSGDGIGSVIFQINNQRQQDNRPEYRYQYEVYTVNGAQVINNPIVDQRRREERAAYRDFLRAQLNGTAPVEPNNHQAVVRQEPEAEQVDTSPLPQPEVDVLVPETNGNFGASDLSTEFTGDTRAQAEIDAAAQAHRDIELAHGAEARKQEEINAAVQAHRDIELAHGAQARQQAEIDAAIQAHRDIELAHGAQARQQAEMDAAIQAHRDIELAHGAEAREQAEIDAAVQAHRDIELAHGAEAREQAEIDAAVQAHRDIEHEHGARDIRAREIEEMATAAIERAERDEAVQAHRDIELAHGRAAAAEAEPQPVQPSADSPSGTVRRMQLSDVLIEPYGDFRVLPNRVGAEEETINTVGTNTRVRIVGERGSMYVVHLYQDGERIGGDYLIDKSWAQRTFNMQAVLDMIEMGEMVEDLGTAPGHGDCLPDNAQPVDEAELREEVGTQQVVEASTEDFKPGCEVLAGDLGEASAESLRTCMGSIRRAIATDDARVGGQLQRDKLFCNMFSNLRPEEQHFAGMIFASVGEAGEAIMDSRTPDPKHQEAAFVMLTMDNRLREMRGHHGDGVNALDVALMTDRNARWGQYSFSNEGDFNRHRAIYEPDSRVYDNKINRSIDAFIAVQSNREGFQPADVINNIGNYYGPSSMQRISSLPAVRQAAARRLVRDLKAQGKIPQNHPDDRVAPPWDFSNLTMRENISYEGVNVRTDAARGPVRHVFYEQTGGSIYYGARSLAPPKWRDREGVPACN